MEIYINDTKIEVGDEIRSVISLFEKMEMNVMGCAVAINNVIVPARRWNETLLKEGDVITLIRATQGG